MRSDLPEVHRRLTKVLTDAGVSYKSMHHGPVYTSEEAAAERGTPLHSGAKALIVKAHDTFFLVVIPADLSLNNNALRKYLDTHHLRFASKKELFDLTGLTPGSIPPFGSLFGLRTICDERLSENERINFNAGSHTDSLQITYQDYVDYEAPELVKVTR